MKEVVIIGGGIAGLEVALRTERKGFQVQLIEPKEDMLFYPSAHKLLEGHSEEEFTINYGEKFEDRNIVHIEEKAKSLELEKNLIKTETREVEYDYLVISTGSQTEFYNVPGQEKASTMRFKEQPKEIYRELSENGKESVAIVGGGATGVEATASLLEMRKEKGFEISLIHSRERLLNHNGRKLSQSVEQSFSEKNVNLVLGQKVIEIKEDKVSLQNGGEIKAELVLWAGGVKPNSFIDQLDLQKNKSGLKVNENMQTSKANVFAAGDNCSYSGKVNRALYAIFEAKTVADNILRISQDRELKERKISLDPEIIYLGEGDSALDWGEKCFRGLIPSLIRNLGVEKRYLWSRKYLL